MIEIRVIDCMLIFGITVLLTFGGGYCMGRIHEQERRKTEWKNQ